MGEARAKNSAEKAAAAMSPPQKASADTCRARCSSFAPKACAMTLAPPTAKRLETAVSITNTGPTTVTAAVCRGSLSRPTK